MKLAYLLGVTIMIAPIGIAAQSGASPPQQQPPAGYSAVQVVRVGPDGQRKTFTVMVHNPCPVSFEARHLADGEMVETAAKHGKGRGQALHVTLTSPDKRAITGATLKLNGWTGMSRMQPANQSAARAFRILQTPFTAGAGRTANADVWVPGLTAVDSVELLAVTYADGSAWSPAAGKSCRVTPDPLMRVGK